MDKLIQSIYDRSTFIGMFQLLHLILENSSFPCIIAIFFSMHFDIALKLYLKLGLFLTLWYHLTHQI